MVSRVIVAAALMSLVAVIGSYTGYGSAGPREVSAEASYPVLINPDICTALRASSATGDSRTQQGYACLFPEGQGGVGVFTYAGHPVLNIYIIAAGVMRNGSHDEFNTIDGGPESVTPAQPHCRPLRVITAIIRSPKNTPYKPCRAHRGSNIPS